MCVVHGDLRTTNVMWQRLADDSIDVKFIDYDWAGMLGTARYPSFVSPVVYPKWVESGKLMPPDADESMIKAWDLA